MSGSKSSKSRRVGSACAAVVAVLFWAEGCASGTSGAVSQASIPTAVSTVSSTEAALATPPPTTGSANASKPSVSPASPTSPGALPASAPGDHQQVVEAMDSVGRAGLPIHKTADLGATSRVYQ